MGEADEDVECEDRGRGCFHVLEFTKLVEEIAAGAVFEENQVAACGERRWLDGEEMDDVVVGFELLEDLNLVWQRLSSASLV